MNLIEALQKAGACVHGFDRSEKPAIFGDDIAWTIGDFSSNEDVDSAVSGKDVVFHLISTSVPSTAQADRVLDVQRNLIPSIALMDACVKHNVKKLTFISSGGTVYGLDVAVPTPEDAATNPISAYGATKLAIEKYMGMYSAVYGLSTAIVRLSNPYGRHQTSKNNQGAIRVFMDKMLAGEPISIWGAGDVVRDYIYIDDVSDALIKISETEKLHAIYNVGTGRGHDLLQVIAELEKVMDTPARINYLPKRPVDVPTNVLDISKAKREIGWVPRVSLRSGLETMYEWVRVNK